MAAENPILELRGVSKVYASSDAEPTPVLRDVNLRVARGETIAIIGPSGSGKSTLLNIIGTLDGPSGGEMLLDGQDVSTLDDRQLAEVRNRKIGFVFQLHHLLPQCTIMENVLIPTLARRADDDAEGRARRLLDRVGLSQRLTHRPGQLSGGERQRVAVVRALINRPGLLLADEPTGSLDHEGADNLCRLLVELNREERVTLIMVTHSSRLAGRMGRACVLDKGTLADAQAPAAGED